MDDHLYFRLDHDHLLFWWRETVRKGMDLCWVTMSKAGFFGLESREVVRVKVKVRCFVFNMLTVCHILCNLIISSLLISWYIGEIESILSWPPQATSKIYILHSRLGMWRLWHCIHKLYLFLFHQNFLQTIWMRWLI